MAESYDDMSQQSVVLRAYRPYFFASAPLKGGKDCLLHLHTREVRSIRCSYCTDLAEKKEIASLLLSPAVIKRARMMS